ncbi:hypothetical protein PY32053_04604 (plasmid) [Paracoccus yeei]|uniref:Uncharacterized protein n=1 Tax=Paracoccus yeei TaxID=147645 RepID=A0A386UV29_9RHOB|nr:hypothetical protein [Paracoccus yeei]AYF04099.1 hypothetical protein PY32053_04604 [Paracoccus yeei]
MAREAGRLLVDSGWLPEPLRLAMDGDDPAAQSADLPEFLIEDANGAADGAEVDRDVPAIAAERPVGQGGVLPCRPLFNPCPAWRNAGPISHQENRYVGISHLRPCAARHPHRAGWC